MSDMLLTTLTFLSFSLRLGQQESINIGADERATQARTALEYVERVRNSPCNGGTDEVLPVQFDHKIWSHFADVAVRMSNLLTKIMLEGNGTLAGVNDEFLFNLVRDNVDGDTLIFGSAIAVEEYAYPKYKTFCPYAFKKDKVYAHDISLNYNYLDPSTEWYNVLRQKDWVNVTVTTNMITYRYNTTAPAAQRAVIQPMAQLEDGHWTSPYFDCGGGDIWMVTYSAPIFTLVNNTPVFRGIGTIDIELTNIDINQCDVSASDVAEEGKTKSVDVFRGTHHCQPSTKCVPVQGEGFHRGAYLCECRDGFYFPILDARIKAFNGTLIEQFYASRGEENTSLSIGDLREYECLRCAVGCDTCVDESPCLYSHVVALRVVLLILTLLIIGFVVSLFFLVTIFKSSKPIKSASPMFLHIMITGAFFMCLPMVIMYWESSDVTCILAIWPRHIGFSLLYGGLLMKTWRISQIFKVKSARKLNLTDRVLGQRLVPIVLVAALAVALWTSVGTPHVIWRRTSNTDLKFKDCASSIWEYGVLIVEMLFLLWGAYLCYSVRKAPSHFNESKYITWAIYNNILLGSFILIIRQFIGTPLGPDAIYAVDFAFLQISVTGTMCLIFVPKIYNLRAGSETEKEDVVQETITGRTKNKPAYNTTLASEGLVNVAVQTDMTLMEGSSKGKAATAMVGSKHKVHDAATVGFKHKVHPAS